MTESKTRLGNYLGLWKYHRDEVTKYYQVLPQGEKFAITWAENIEALASPNCPRIVVESADECYRRILSKARGRYSKIEQCPEMDWNLKSHETFKYIDSVLASEEAEAKKRKPRKRRLSLLDWVSGMDEYRENDEI